MSRYDYAGFDSNLNVSIGLSGCRVDFEPVEGKGGTTWIVKHVTSWNGKHYTRAITLQDALQTETIGLDEDAARFIAEWYPECAGTVCSELEYWPYNDCSIRQTRPENFRCFLEENGITQDEYEEQSGTVLEDAAFDGLVVIGE